jgi:hypothetical protein
MTTRLPLRYKGTTRQTTETTAERPRPSGILPPILAQFEPTVFVLMIEKGVILFQ